MGLAPKTLFFSVLTASITLAGCDRAPDESATATAAAPVNAAPAAITFAASTHDFGEMYETEERATRFEFTNTGGDLLVIQEVKTSCGCTAARLDDREYRPGESGSIDVVFDPPGSGSQTKHITVVSNAQPEAVTRLTIQAEVKPFIVFEPSWLRLGVLPYGREHRATVSVTSPDEGFTIEEVRTTSAHAIARAVAGSTNVEVIIPATTPWGGCYFALEVVARGRPFPGAQPVLHTSRIRVAAQLFGELSAEPDMFRFGVAAGEPIERTIRLSGAGGRPFAVLDVTVVDQYLPDATATAERVSPDAWDLTLRATAPPRAARCLGSVNVRTDVPGEERIRIGILGVVRAPPRGG
jgi:hypothetical protein